MKTYNYWAMFIGVVAIMWAYIVVIKFFSTGGVIDTSDLAAFGGYSGWAVTELQRKPLIQYRDSYETEVE